ncbi:MAG: DUF503 domain-containing protein [Phycisphaerales bacterium]
MLVGILQIEVLIPEAESLKDKRRVVRSLKDRLHREHQVSVAEVDAQERHRVAVLGVSMVSSDGRRIGATFDTILRKVQSTPGAMLGDHRRDILDGEAPGGFLDESGDPLWTEDDRREGAEERGAA